MTVVGQFENFGLRRSLGNVVNLRQRGILVVEALYREQRAFDRVDLVFDRPGTESGIQPYIIPAPESRIRIVVVAGKFSNWIAPPSIGINRQAVNFEYIRFNRVQFGSTFSLYPV